MLLLALRDTIYRSVSRMSTSTRAQARTRSRPTDDGEAGAVQRQNQSRLGDSRLLLQLEASYRSRRLPQGACRDNSYDADATEVNVFVKLMPTASLVRPFLFQQLLNQSLYSVGKRLIGRKPIPINVGPLVLVIYSAPSTSETKPDQESHDIALSSGSQI